MKCIKCGRSRGLERHHIDYKKEKTVMLCRSCHRQVHYDGKSPFFPVNEPIWTVIALKPSTKKRLDHYGKMSQSYDKLLNVLMDATPLTAWKKRWKK